MNYIFLVMELMEGGTLKELMIQRYKEEDYFFKEDECAIILKNILQGIKYLHSLKIVHRDIKPDNIMLQTKGDLNSIKLGDFGFSTLEQVYDEKECGTLIYMPPESQQYNESADIWAAGFILYILVSGGEHPIFRRKMTYNEYVECFRERSKDWKINKEIPM
jgi:calcium/calmodulin-dependent protein kinase I